MDNPLILSIDQGTTGTTVLLLDAELRVVAQASQSFPQHFPQSGYVEHNPEEIWDSLLKALQALLGSDPSLAPRIVGIGITNQRETCLIWERQSGKAVAPAIVWQDRRTAARCQELAADHQAELQRRTGLQLDPYFSATKIRWIIEERELSPSQLDQGVYCAGTIDSYLLWRLSGGPGHPTAVHATEASNASRTLLWNLKHHAERDDWDPELLKLFGIPRALLPRVLNSDQEFARTQNVPGLPNDIPICAILGDQQAALMGQLCTSPGLAKCTYGTGAFALMYSGDQFHLSKHRLLTSVAWQLQGQSPHYCLEGSVFMAGALVQWLRDGLGIIQNSPDIEALARQVESSEGVVVIPAHTGLGAPHWRPEARGLICGLSRGTHAAHVARAALEAIALSVHDLLEAMQRDAGSKIAELRVDGGAASNDLLMQIQSDIAQIPLRRPDQLESTALGVGILAGLSRGIWKDLETLAQRWKTDRDFQPQVPPEHHQALKSRYRKALEFAG